MKILWNVLLVVLALFCGALVMMPIEAINNRIYPLPEGLSTQDMEGMRKHIATLPTSAFILVWVSHFTGPLVATFLAARFAAYRSLIPASVIGVFYLITGVMVSLMLGATLFFVVIDWPLYPLATLLGITLGRQRGAPAVTAPA